MYCQLEVSSSGRSLAQIPTECSVSECDREASIIMRPWSTRGCCPMRVGNIHMHKRICEYVFFCIRVCVCVICACKQMCCPLYFFKCVLLLVQKLCTALYNKCILLSSTCAVNQASRVLCQTSCVLCLVRPLLVSVVPIAYVLRPILLYTSSCHHTPTGGFLPPFDDHGRTPDYYPRVSASPTSETEKGQITYSQRSFCLLSLSQPVRCPLR